MIARIVWMGAAALVALVVGAELARLERVEETCAVRAEMEDLSHELAMSLLRVTAGERDACVDVMRSHAEMHEACSCWIAWEVQP